MSKTVGAYDAKTHLPQLLERVARGERITITKRGTPIAMLVPPESAPTDVSALIEEFRAFRAGKSLGGIPIRELIEAGRRY